MTVVQGGPVPHDAGQALKAELVDLASPLLAVDSPDGMRRLLAQVGWDANALPGLDVGALVKALDAARIEVERIATNADASFPALIEAAARLGAPVATIAEQLSGWQSAQFLTVDELMTLIEDITHGLLDAYLARRWPLLRGALVFAGVIVVSPHPAIVVGGKTVRRAQLRPRLDTSTVSRAMQDPLAFLRTLLTDSSGQRRAAHVLADLLGPVLAELLSDLGIPALYGPLLAENTKLTAEQVAAVPHVFVIDWLQPALADGLPVSTRYRLVMGLVDDAGGKGFGLVVATTNTAGFSLATAGLKADLAIGGVPTAVLITGSEISAPAGATVDPSVTLTVASPGTGPEPALQLGDLTVRRLALNFEFKSSPAPDIGGEIDLSGVALRVSGDGRDGFLQSVLGAAGIAVEFDLGLTWSTREGLRFRAGAGAALPVKADLLGVVRIDSARAYLEMKTDAVTAVVAVTARVILGPVTITVDSVGIAAGVTFPKSGGNLGPADLALRFKPPSGAAIKVDSGFAVGGGYLFFDPDAGQYAGVMQLELGGRIALKAIGIVTTKMPDGSAGFSLLVLITAEGFAPIPLGFGFTLAGIGGLLGINRTANVAALRAGVKTGSIDSVMFPSDPVGRAPAIVSTLNTLMPPAAGRFLVGPMALITWGSPTVLTIKLAVLIEVPQPVRLLVLARLSALLPDARQPVVRINMDAFGVIDFEKGDLALDATLFDSKLGEFGLTGDMALRLNWGAAPTFVLAIGGFNPRFQAPADFPRLERVSVSLAQTASFKLRLSAYLAITSNTAQIGARVDLRAMAGDFSLEGSLSFDALLQFGPAFGFVADLSASLVVRYQSTVLFSVFVETTLAGPAPWHINGKASLEIGPLKFEVAFDHRFGPAAPLELPTPVDIGALLRAELADLRNWDNELPAGEHPLVSLREARVNAVLVHPLATITVRQRRLPIHRRITRMGSATLVGGPRALHVEVTGARGAKLSNVHAVEDLFARAQFEFMTDAEQLVAPSFEPMISGYRVGSAAITYDPATARHTAVEYETATFDPLASAPAPSTAAASTFEPLDGDGAYLVPAETLSELVSRGAAATATLRRSGYERYQAPPALGAEEAGMAR